MYDIHSTQLLAAMHDNNSSKLQVRSMAQNTVHSYGKYRYRVDMLADWVAVQR